MHAFLRLLVIALLIGGTALLIADQLHGPQGQAVIAIASTSEMPRATESIDISIDGIEVYTQASGWHRLEPALETVSLTTLSNRNILKRLVRTDELPVDQYQRLRIHIDSVTITQAGEEYTAHLPARTITIDAPITISEDTTTTVVLTFNPTASLHQTTDGTYIFASVVSLTSHTDSAVHIESATDLVTLTKEGVIETNITVGTTARGATKRGFRLDTTDGVTIDDAGHINVLNE